jgi:predicted DCC family thiol-disulfide oxidoreductase YuxK
VNTEITEEYKEWVFYDADCAICTGFARRFQKQLHHRGIGLAPLQAQSVRERLGWGKDEPLTEMKFLTERGEISGGADAIIYLARYFWWGWGLRLMAHLPGARFVLRRAYAWFARRRHCAKGGCKL